MGFFLGQPFDDGDETDDALPSSSDLLGRIDEQDRRIRKLEQLVADLRSLVAVRTNETLRVPQRVTPPAEQLPPLPPGIPVIRHTYGSLYGGREHPDPDGEYSALPLEDGMYMHDDKRYSRPQ